MREFMYLAQPARVTRTSGTPNTYTISNRRFYTSLDDLVLSWQLVVDGVVVEHGTSALPHIAPQTSADVQVTFTVTPTSESFINWSFSTRTATAWAPAGHVVAWEQNAITVAPRAALPIPATPQPVAHSGTVYTLGTGAHTARIDATSGALLAFGATGSIVSGPRLNVWRAPTDNDHLQEMMARMVLRGYPLWRKLGLTELVSRVESVAQTAAGVLVTVASTGRNQWDDIRARHTYSIDAQGALHIDTTVDCAPDIVDLPRLGIALELAAPYTNLHWYGRGPEDTYNDRKSGAFIGQFKSTVAEQYVPYIMPQEHGHHVDVRWLSLTDTQGHGYDIRADGLFEFNALHHSDAALERATDTISLKADQTIHLSLDVGMRGLGTGLFVDTLPEYLLNARTYQFHFVLQPR
jgi:beta-galactosidase